MNHKVLLFDLDGTLTDPKVGITKSVQYALEKMNRIEVDLKKLELFIGPPLQESFPLFYKMDIDETNMAIGYYRDRFKEIGMYENDLYPQIKDLLSSLKKQGKLLVIATSKPTVFSDQIVKYFELDGFFNMVVGSNLDGTRVAKAEIIQYILAHYSSIKKKDFIMIGDRKHDIIGANTNGIESIGVTYGYGSEHELRNAGATYVVHSVSELGQLLNT